MRSGPVGICKGSPASPQGLMTFRGRSLNSLGYMCLQSPSPLPAPCGARVPDHRFSLTLAQAPGPPGGLLSPQPLLLHLLLGARDRRGQGRPRTGHSRPVPCPDHRADPCRQDRLRHWTGPGVPRPKADCHLSRCDQEGLKQDYLPGLRSPPCQSRGLRVPAKDLFPGHLRPHAWLASNVWPVHSWHPASGPQPPAQTSLPAGFRSWPGPNQI